VPVGEQPGAELTVGVIVRQDVRQVAGQRRDIDAGYLGGRAAAGRVGQFPVVLEEAFATSPAEIERGPSYEFVLNHVLDLDQGTGPFRLDLSEVAHA